MRILATIAASTAVIAGAVTGQRGDVSRQPIIDMHMHAVPADYFGEPPTKMCSTGMYVPMGRPQGPQVANQPLRRTRVRVRRVRG